MEINLVHEKELTDNNLKVSDLPTEIKAKITGLKMSLGRYSKSPSESAKEAIEKTSAQIAHAIMDFVEKDLEEEPEGGENEQNQTPPQQNPQQVQNPTPQPTQTQEQAQAEAEAKALAYTLETQEANNEKERLEKIKLQEQADAEVKAKAQAEKEARDYKGVFGWLGY